MNEFVLFIYLFLNQQLNHLQKPFQPTSVP